MVEFRIHYKIESLVLADGLSVTFEKTKKSKDKGLQM